MRLLSFLVWKSWVSSPLRALLSFSGIALGVAIVAAIHILDHNTILSELMRKRADFGRVDLELVPLDDQTPLATQQERLEAMDGIDRAGLYIETPVHLMQGGKPVEQILLVGVHPVGSREFRHYLVDEGRDLERLGPEGDVLLSRVLANRLKLQVGAELLLQALPPAQVLACKDGKRVAKAAVAREELASAKLKVRGILEPFGVPNRNAGLVVIGSFALAKRLARGALAKLQIRKAEGVDPDALMEALRASYRIEDSRSALIGEGADERAFRNGVKVLGCLALVLGMFVIFHTLSHSLAERMRSIGTLRCLGATSAQVTRVFLLDSVLLSLLGTAAGLIGGAVLAYGLGRLQITTLGLGKTVRSFELPWHALLPIAGLSVFFTLVGAAFPLFKIRRLDPKRILYVRDLAPPADLLRGVNVFLFVVLVFALPLVYLAMTPLLEAEGKGAGVVLFEAVGIIALFFAVLLLSPRIVRVLGGLFLVLVRRAMPLQVFLVKKKLLHAPARLATSICGISLVALTMIGLHSITASLKGEVRDFGARGMRSKLFLKYKNPLPAEHWARLSSIRGVQNALPRAGLMGLPFLTIGTDSRELGKDGSVFAGKPELVAKLRATRSLLISTRLARLQGLELGSKVRVPVNGKVVAYEVLAISDAEGFFPDERAFALADRKWLTQDFCIETGFATQFSLRLDGTRAPEAVLDELRSLPFEIAWGRTGKEVEDFHVADVDRDFLFFDILLGLLLLLAGLGQVNLITMSTIARSREIGILRALGLTRGDFVRMLLVEAGLVGVLSALLAIAAGIPLSYILVRGLRFVSGLEVPFTLSMGPILIVAAIAFLVSLLSALVPALRATGLPPAQAVRSTD